MSVPDVARVPRLMLVTDRLRSSLPLADLARSAVAGGVDLVQVREKDLAVDDLRRIVASIVEAVGDPARVSVNGDVGLAKGLGTGVHLPEEGAAVRQARQLLGSTVLIGRSVHSPESARQSEGADYLIAGHVFATASKPDRPPIGLEGLRRIVEAAPCPVLAIGGITATNAGSVIGAGAYGAAVVSAINGAVDPAEAACAIRRQLPGNKEFTVDATATKIEVTINGKAVGMDAGTTVQHFLESKGYQDRLVVVELNEAILPRASYPSTMLSTGDRVEIVHFVGGG
ncbi:MAG: hypothetical protein QOF33_1834 [Thermomicrobiales bacterium]|nr:hypothetical protein [Thermomicrobiales bacterium]